MVPGRAAGVRHLLYSPIGVHDQAARIFDLPAVVQLCLFLKLFGDERSKTIVRKSVVPDEEVAGRVENSAAAAIIVETHRHLPATALLLVSEGAVLDDFPHVDAV